MKVGSINQLSFRAIENNVKTDNSTKNPEQEEKSIDKKKLLYATLGALALVGTTMLIVNNAKKGKIKAPEVPTGGNKGINPPPSDPKTPTVEIKPTAEPATQEAKPKVDKPEGKSNLPENDKSQTNAESPKSSDDATGKADNAQTEVSKTPSEPEPQVQNSDNSLKSGVDEPKQAIPENEIKTPTDTPKTEQGNSSQVKPSQVCANEPEVTTFDNGTVKYVYPKAEDGSQTTKFVYTDGHKRIDIVKKNGNKFQTELDENDNPLYEIYKTKNSNTAKYFEEGKLLKTVSQDATGKTITELRGDIKTSFHKNKDGSTVYKIYQKDDNGKYHCIKRETSNVKIYTHSTANGYSENVTYDSKTVDYINNGEYSRTVTVRTEPGAGEIDDILIRDKKGNIVDNNKITKGASGPDGPDADAPKLLAAWYKDYLALCKKYGVSPRMCGVKGGAWDHYYELSLKANDPQAYESYIRLQEYRAKYDEKAALENLLRFAEKHGISLNPSLLSDLSPDEISSLINQLVARNIKLEQLEKLNSKQVRELMVETEEKLKIQAQQEAENLRQLEEQRQIEAEEAERLREKQRHTKPVQQPIMIRA